MKFTISFAFPPALLLDDCWWVFYRAPLDESGISPVDVDAAVQPHLIDMMIIKIRLRRTYEDNVKLYLKEMCGREVNWI
jgi:hypothetical protein